MRSFEPGRLGYATLKGHLHFVSYGTRRARHTETRRDQANGPDELVESPDESPISRQLIKIIGY